MNHFLADYFITFAFVLLYLTRPKKKEKVKMLSDNKPLLLFRTVPPPTLYGTFGAHILQNVTHGGCQMAHWSPRLEAWVFELEGKIKTPAQAWNADWRYFMSVDATPNPAYPLFAVSLPTYRPIEHANWSVSWRDYEAVLTLSHADGESQWSWRLFSITLPPQSKYPAYEETHYGSAATFKQAVSDLAAALAAHSASSTAKPFDAK